MPVVESSAIAGTEAALGRARGHSLVVACATTDGSDPGPVVERAAAACTVAHSVRTSFPVTTCVDHALLSMT